MILKTTLKCKGAFMNGEDTKYKTMTSSGCLKSGLCSVLYMYNAAGGAHVMTMTCSHMLFNIVSQTQIDQVELVGTFISSTECSGASRLFLTGVALERH